MELRRQLIQRSKLFSHSKRAKVKRRDHVAANAKANDLIREDGVSMIWDIHWLRASSVAGGEDRPSPREAFQLVALPKIPSLATYQSKVRQDDKGKTTTIDST